MQRLLDKTSSWRYAILALGAFVPALIALNCDEALPPREEPRIVLTAVLGVNPGRYRFRVYTPTDSTQPPVYASNPATVYIQVTNTYDEVLEDSLGVDGTVELWDTRRPNMLGTVSLRGAAIIPTFAVNNGLLTLEAQARITVKTAWNHMTVNGGGPMWKGLELYPDTNAWGEPFYYTDTILVAARARLTLFKKLGVVETPLVEVPLSYEIFPNQ